jgi:hypothetical protein
MRHLLRCLVLALVVIPALASVSSARPVSDTRLEACVDGAGHCSVTGDQCATSGQCPNPPSGQRCICD